MHFYREFLEISNLVQKFWLKFRPKFDVILWNRAARGASVDVILWKRTVRGASVDVILWKRAARGASVDVILWKRTARGVSVDVKLSKRAARGASVDVTLWMTPPEAKFFITFLDVSENDPRRRRKKLAISTDLQSGMLSGNSESHLRSQKKSPKVDT